MRLTGWQTRFDRVASPFNGVANAFDRLPNPFDCLANSFGGPADAFDWRANAFGPRVNTFDQREKAFAGSDGPSRRAEARPTFGSTRMTCRHPRARTGKLVVEDNRRRDFDCPSAVVVRVVLDLDRVAVGDAEVAGAEKVTVQRSTEAVLDKEVGRVCHRPFVPHPHGPGDSVRVVAVRIEVDVARHGPGGPTVARRNGHAVNG